MQVSQPLDAILDRALGGQPPTRDECVYLLEFESDSLEAGLLRSVANGVSRRRFSGEALVFGQIGVEASACPGGCDFCVFGEGHVLVEPHELTSEEIVEKSRAFACGGDLFALYLMTMHTFDMERLLGIVGDVRAAIPAHTRLVVNIGDIDVDQARALKAVGVQAAYHVCRLREGTDTRLDPERRKATFAAIRAGGLEFAYCCEPIGPEHTAAELADQLLLGLEHGCVLHGAMRRVAVPQLPLGGHGQISELRLAQIVAVVALAGLSCSGLETVGVHEPNLLGLTSGANAVFAETGANPRDTAAETSGARGLDVAASRAMLREAGFRYLRRGDGSRVELTPEYMAEKAAFGSLPVT